MSTGSAAEEPLDGIRLLLVGGDIDGGLLGGKIGCCVLPVDEDGRDHAGEEERRLFDDAVGVGCLRDSRCPGWKRVVFGAVVGLVFEIFCPFPLFIRSKTADGRLDGIWPGLDEGCCSFICPLRLLGFDPESLSRILLMASLPRAALIGSGLAATVGLGPTGVPASPCPRVSLLSKAFNAASVAPLAPPAEEKKMNQ